MQNSEKAFTLIELLIVVAIIAILAAIAVPSFLDARTRAMVSKTKADMKSIVTAIKMYEVDHNDVMSYWTDKNQPYPPDEFLSEDGLGYRGNRVGKGKSQHWGIPDHADSIHDRYSLG